MANGSGLSYVYVGAARWTGGKLGGLFRQAVGDTHWEALTKGLPERTAVQAITVHPDESGGGLPRHPGRAPTGASTTGRAGSASASPTPARRCGRSTSTRETRRCSTRAPRRWASTGARTAATPGAACRTSAARAGEDGLRLSGHAPGRGPQPPRRGLRGAGGRGRHAQPRRRRDAGLTAARSCSRSPSCPTSRAGSGATPTARACWTPTRSA